MPDAQPLRLTKRVIGHLDRCYALELLTVEGRPCVLVAAEPDERCLLFSPDGEFLDTVWEHPGGVMGMAAIPGRDGAFFTIHRFYSFNDAQDACISLVEHAGDGWHVREVVKIPFLHRITILSSPAGDFLVACQLKAAHAYDDDWRTPGRLLAIPLADALSGKALTMADFAVIADNLPFNHGCWKQRLGNMDTVLIASGCGISRLIPPSVADAPFTMESLSQEPSSDALLFDLDGDGQEELLSITPFHGDGLVIYHRGVHGYEPVWRYDVPLPFLHGITAGVLHGTPMLLAGNRAGDRGLYAVTCDAGRGTYAVTELDRGTGPANLLLVRQQDGTPTLFAAGREAGEIAMYW